LDPNYQTWIVAGENYQMPKEDCETIQQKIAENANNQLSNSPKTIMPQGSPNSPEK